MMERTESCFFVKQSLPKGLMGAFLLFCVTFLMFLFVEGAFFYPRYGFLQQLRKENQEVLFFYRHYDAERENRLYGFFELFEQKGQGMHAEETLLKRSEKGNKLIFQTKIVHFATEIVTI